MRRVFVCSAIDEASRIFSDSILLAKIILVEKDLRMLRRKLSQALHELTHYSLRVREEDMVTYVRINVENMGLVVRLLSYGEVLIACTYEKEGEALIGRRAFNLMDELSLKEDPVAVIKISKVSSRDLEAPLANYVTLCIQEFSSVSIPYIWIGRRLYDLNIERVLSDKDPYVYELIGVDDSGRKYLVKVFKDKLLDGQPFAIKGMVEPLRSMLSKYAALLSLIWMNSDVLREELVSKGLAERTIEALIKFREHIHAPRALIVIRDKYSERDYAYYPITLVEDYPDLGNLESYMTEKKRIRAEDIVSIITAIAGALALLHCKGLVHLNVKPQNIVLFSDEKHGLRPALSGHSRISLNNATIGAEHIDLDYSDPIALLKGRVTYSYDLYSLGLTAYYMSVGRKHYLRTLLNTVIAKEVYGVKAHPSDLIPEEPYLLELTKDLEEVLGKYVRDKSINLKELVQSLINIIKKDDEKLLKEVDSKELRELIKRTTSLSEEDRYKDSIALIEHLL